MITKLLIGMGHPAHFHLFKNTIYQLRNDGVEVKIVVTEKDILERLLITENFEFIKIAGRKKKEGVIDKIIKLAKSTIELKRIVRAFKPDLLIGSLSQLSYVGKLSGIPVMFFGEDDITYTWMQCLVTYPFVDYIVAPDKTKVGIFKYKKISYPGYQKLAYLHPEVFHPDAALIPEINTNETYTIIRLVSLTAYHDVNVGGIGSELLDQIIGKLSKFGKVYITSEKKLPEHLMKYALPVETANIHHALAFASLFVGDSQSMCVEAAMLGVPSLKFNDFAGRISILEDLEKKYQLTCGFKTSQGEELLSKIEEIFTNSDLKSIYQERRKSMLMDKTNVTSFYVWLIKNFPDSIDQYKSGRFRFNS